MGTFAQMGIGKKKASLFAAATLVVCLCGLLACSGTNAKTTDSGTKAANETTSVSSSEAVLDPYAWKDQYPNQFNSYIDAGYVKYSDKQPNVKFTLSFADIVTRLGRAWSPALRSVLWGIAREGRLLVSTFHRPPAAHIMESDEERTPFEAYDEPTLRQWTARRRADKLADELDQMEDIEEIDEDDFEEEE